jgi:hypothetical protein
MWVFFATITTLGVIMLVGWYIVQNDVGNTTGPKTNVPIVTEVGFGEDGATIEVNEPLFSFKLPVDWKLQERKSDPPNINAYTWVATNDGQDDRKLTLHVDIMPQSYKLVKMWPIMPNNNALSLGNLSDDCINFAGTNHSQSTAPVPAKWENVSFTCDPIKNNQTIGTGTPGSSIGTEIGNHTFFFFYEDYNIYPDDGILRGVLQSFQTK